MPQAASFISSTSVPEAAEKVPLFIPSSLPPHIQHQPKLSDIRDKEWQMREAQADDSLAHIRRLHRVIQGMWQFKKFSISGTGNRPNTCLLQHITLWPTTYKSTLTYTAPLMQPCRYLILVACGLIT